MFGALFRPLARRGVRRVALAVVAVVLVAVAWFCRGSFVHRATAQPARTAPPTPGAAAASASATDYDSRIVAFVHDNPRQAITRQELGEFLIARHGAEKLPLLINKRILDHAC